MRALRVLLVVVLAVCALTLGSARPAAAAAPCWKQLLNDWYDGRIDKTYPIPCYNQALAHLPTDVQVYSSARDDIQRALASAIRKQNSGGGSEGSGGSSSGGGTSGEGDGSSGGGTATNGRETSNGPFGEAIDKVNPSSADSLPLPVLILGALALLLVGAGLAGLVVRHYQARGPAV